MSTLNLQKCKLLISKIEKKIDYHLQLKLMFYEIIFRIFNTFSFEENVIFIGYVIVPCAEQ